MSDLIMVLAGGLSHERDVSLRSGRRVAEALREAGHDVVERDVDSDLVPGLRTDPPACVVPMLHGETGEDGAIRVVFEVLGIPYVGSRPTACRTTFDKPVAKSVVERAGIKTPAGICLPHETFRELGAPAMMAAVVEHLGLPLMVKPARSGSALGCSVVRSAEQLPAAMVAAFAYGRSALVEQFVTGVEVAVPVIEIDQVARAMPEILIEPDGGVYDYTARYTAGATRFTIPSGLDDAVVSACAEVAVTAHQALGLRDLSRSDLIVDDAGQVWFLEANVAPGFTETSLVPLSIEAAGLTMAEVCSDLVSQAQQR